MGDYYHDMSEEKKPAGVLPEGLRLVRTTEMIFGKSKNQNDQFVTTIEDVKTKKTMNVWLVAEPKKRWMLKSLLDACAVPKNAEGKHDWSTTNVIGKPVFAYIEHYKEPWINREGKEVMLDKCKVTEFSRYEEPETEKTINAEDIVWKD